MRLVHTIRHPSRVQDVKLAVHNGNDVLLVGAEDKKISVYSLSAEPNTPPNVFAEMTGHQNRCVVFNAFQFSKNMLKPARFFQC
jgi:protein MAK11